MSANPTLTWSAAWTTDLSSDGDVVLTAGPDRMLALRGITPELVARLVAWRTGAIVATTPDEVLLLDRLVDAGIAAPPTPHRFAILGPEADCDRLATALRPHAELAPVATASAAVLVRGEDGWAVPAGLPHLAVDARFHHTLVIGPFVVPGHSACTACLETRVTRRWPRSNEPTEPAATRWTSVLAELIRIQLELIASARSPLVNATAAWDLERGTVDRQTLLKVPGCAQCATASGTGRLRATWLESSAVR